MRTKLLIALIAIELVGITILGLRLYEKKKSVLGITSINPIRKETINIVQLDNLKYFYEPKANSIIKDSPAWLGYLATNTINSDSLNERFEYPTNKPDDSYRIITLGDSFTYGLYVNTKDNWPEKLEDYLNERLSCKNIKKFEVINLGVSNYDIKYSQERYKIRGQKYNPDLIIWFIVYDDMTRVNEIRIPITNTCKKELYQTDKLYIEKRNFCEQSYKDSIITNMGKDQIREYQQKVFNEFDNYFNKDLLLFTYAINDQNDENLIRNFANSRPRTYFYNLLSNVEILPDGHPSAKGYNQIANDLFKYLTENKIIPCN